uniref:Uncharacterized protein n=1 Tax=Anguilla anguilla TaxID=7936 RepID=A0A0E9SW76_ANGAN
MLGKSINRLGNENFLDESLYWKPLISNEIHNFLNLI